MSKFEEIIKQNLIFLNLAFSRSGHQNIQAKLYLTVGCKERLVEINKIMCRAFTFVLILGLVFKQSYFMNCLVVK